MPKRGVILRLDSDSLIQLQRGIFNELDRDGLPVRVDRDIAYELGNIVARTCRTSQLFGGSQRAAVR